jgi:YHS domain-containing protein
MNKRRMVVTGVVTAVILLGALAASAENASVSATTNEPAAMAGQPQTTCPVMDEPINKKSFVDYQGKRVYFCCNMCPATFLKDPEKYMKKLHDQGIALEDTPQADAHKPALDAAVGTENGEQAGHHHE